QIGLHIRMTLPTLAAIALLYLRIYLFDCLLAAVNKHREVALIATLTTTFAGVAALAAFWAHDQLVASLLFPAAAAVLTLFYAIRNFEEFAAAVDRQASRFALEKAALIAILLILIDLDRQIAILGGVLVLMVALDARQALLLLSTFRRRKPLGSHDLSVQHT
ncbi:hypothetical protein, partial [Silvimonas sp.]|uniref:hypothetical protein n=1 Tax=Silvimonas sp. TaxID=2650811 RepID=UPI00284B4AC6